MREYFGGDPTPQLLLDTPDEPLRAAGVSGNKIKAMRDLAARTLDGTVPVHSAIRKMPDAEIIERLTAVRGIGTWTAEMLLIFRLGGPDVLPVTDYGVRKGFALTFQRLPKSRALEAADLPKAEDGVAPRQTPFCLTSPSRAGTFGARATWPKRLRPQGARPDSASGLAVKWFEQPPSTLRAAIYLVPMPSGKRFVCIHGHFDQPPREYPWLETVETQDSAAPYHDWNERICAECYAPNGAARVVNAKNQITRIVNNYARMSFNFGPTLLSWLKENAPRTYRMILDGESRSRQRYRGHSSAMAQGYDHMILPLANARDRNTQIRWGIATIKAALARRLRACGCLRRRQTRLRSKRWP